MATVPPPDPEPASTPGGMPSPAAEPTVPPPEVGPIGPDVDVPDPGGAGDAPLI